LLHTSDWHLGRCLHGVDLLEYQAAYLDHLVVLARVERVQAVVVSGDIFDRAVPPVEAVNLLSESLARLAEVAQVVMTSGNHDSAARLGFAAGLMRPGIDLVTRLDQVGQAVEVPGGDADKSCLIYGLPFLDVDAARGPLAPGDEPLARSHQAVLTAAMDQVRADFARRMSAPTGPGRPSSVVVAHAFVAGGESSESERDIRVGGVDHVPASVFAGVDYVALGHLHRPQQVKVSPGRPDSACPVGKGKAGLGGEGKAGGEPGGGLVRYAGSPLAFGFSELNQTKSTVLVELDRGKVTTRLVKAPLPRRLGEVAGSFEDLMGPGFDDVSGDWLRVTVTDPARPEEMVQRLKWRFPHALVIRHLPAGGESSLGGGQGAANVMAIDPMTVAGDFLAYAAGAPPDQSELAAMDQAREAVRAKERGA